jgi:hypothetical protein
MGFSSFSLNYNLIGIIIMLMDETEAEKIARLGARPTEYSSS